jgi:hypothetical protein
MVEQTAHLAERLLIALIAAPLIASVGIIWFWYLPVVIRFLLRLRKVDREAYDLAGGMPFSSVHGSQPLRLYLDTEMYEKLRDARARELGRSVARADRLARMLFRVAAAGFLIALILLLMGKLLRV